MNNDCLKAIKQELPDDPDQLQKLVQVTAGAHVHVGWANIGQSFDWNRQEQGSYIPQPYGILVLPSVHGCSLIDIFAMHGCLLEKAALEPCTMIPYMHVQVLTEMQAAAGEKAQSPVPDQPNRSNSTASTIPATAEELAAAGLKAMGLGPAISCVSREMEEISNLLK